MRPPKEEGADDGRWQVPAHDLPADTLAEEVNLRRPTDQLRKEVCPGRRGMSRKRHAVHGTGTTSNFSAQTDSGFPATCTQIAHHAIADPTQLMTQHAVTANPATGGWQVQIRPSRLGPNSWPCGGSRRGVSSISPSPAIASTMADRSFRGSGTTARRVSASTCLRDCRRLHGRPFRRGDGNREAFPISHIRVGDEDAHSKDLLGGVVRAVGRSRTATPTLAAVRARVISPAILSLAMPPSTFYSVR